MGNALTGKIIGVIFNPFFWLLFSVIPFNAHASFINSNTYNGYIDYQATSTLQFSPQYINVWSDDTQAGHNRLYGTWAKWNGVQVPPYETWEDFLCGTFSNATHDGYVIVGDSAVLGTSFYTPPYGIYDFYDAIEYADQIYLYSCVSGTGIDNETYIIDITTPENGETLATTTVPITFEIYGNGSFDITLVTTEFGLGGDVYTENRSVTLSGATSYTYTYTLNATSTYTTTATITNVFTGDVSQDSILFHVIATSTQYLESTETWEDIPCSITDLTGCFKKAIAWAFYPTGDPFTDFIGLWDGVKRKPPIGYFYVIVEPVSQLGATTTPLYTLEVPQPMKDDIFGVARTYLQYGFILLFIYFLWYRVTNMHI